MEKHWKESTEEVWVKVTSQQSNYGYSKSFIGEKITGHFSCIFFSPAQPRGNGEIEPIIHKY